MFPFSGIYREYFDTFTGQDNFKADQRRTALDPPLPPISHDQVQHGELASLLTEEDHNLSTMVNL